ncbi:EAL domain-containing protein [Hyphococcus lacteus]|uniref:EAL domain-containing protein n=1 Tax=Hyphococcus lacteus TaxID=3143536 RepID=A0ABV3Z778_9PROT
MGAQAVRLSNVDIDNALKNNNFEVLFQPIFDLGNGALARVETFVRWHHPQLGMLPPGAFISFFESQGRMSELTRFVLSNALEAYSDWRGPYAPGLSINLALSDLSDDAFASHFIKLLRDYNFPADLVTLECPMPPVDMPMDVASAHFKRLADTGARLAIEVRGRANDLLRTLDPFPFDEIKTGGSAILRFARTVRGPGLSAIADLLDIASKANAAITAVGVEDQASLSALRGLGFTAAQGNHLGKVGDIKNFRPHRINDVRELLGLEPLSTESITALFRTEAPAPQPSAPKNANETEATAAKPEHDDAMIERLNERVARYDQSAPKSDEEKTPHTESAAESDEEKKIKAREKAKALALAKRAKARAARKSAAIERAKTKAGLRTTDSISDDIFHDTPNHDSINTSAVPRDMQEQINRAFTSDPEPAEPKAAPKVTPAKPAKEQPEEVDIQSAETGSLLADEPKSEKAPITTEIPQSDDNADAETPEKSTASAPSPTVPENTPARPTPFVGGMDKPISLSVASSSAYFLQGISVGSPALPGTPDTPIAPAGLALEGTSMAEDNGENKTTAKSLSTVERAVASLSKDETPYMKPPEAAPTVESEETTDAVETPTEAAPIQTEVTDDSLGDLQNEEAEIAPETASQPRRRKPFLKRTVVPISPYFWPRSWRRAMHRRATERAVKVEEQTEQRAAAAE